MRVYYSHSMLSYGTFLDTMFKGHLHTLFKNDVIIDPSLLRTKNMKLYYDLIESCDTLVFTEYDRSIGKGVFCEIEHAKKVGVPVFLLRDGVIHSFDNLFIKIFNKNDWKKHYAKVKYTEEYKKIIDNTVNTDELTDEELSNALDGV